MKRAEIPKVVNELEEKTQSLRSELNNTHYDSYFEILKNKYLGKSFQKIDFNNHIQCQFLYEIKQKDKLWFLNSISLNYFTDSENNFEIREESSYIDLDDNNWVEISKQDFLEHLTIINELTFNSLKKSF